MKSFKLQLAIISLALLICFDPLHSQTVQPSGMHANGAVFRQKILTTALRGYEACLRADIEAVVESAIFHAVIMKIKIPDQDYSKIIGEMKRLAFEAANPKLRYKAYLGACIISSPEQFLDSTQSEQLLSFTDERRDEFFAFIAAALKNQL
ncbi:hypothetical protein L0337_19810 [candidate division KSB1 bacterium]|nr:hypothetical protein [candidate division KSB1 bacterium]